MPTYPLFGSTQLDPRIADSSAPSETGVVDELSKGYRRGLRGAGSSLAELAGAGAEAVGATDVASGARGVAGRLREAAGAPELAPNVRSIRDIDSVGSGARWAAGMMGEMTPVLAAAVAGGVMTKNPMVGGTIAMAPFEAGDIASRQDRTQGTAGSRLGEAAAGGLASAAVGNILPAQIMGKFSKGLRGESSFLPAMGKNIAEGVAVGGVSEAGNEGVKQFASRQEFNPEAITEAGLGGAAFGGVFGAPAGVASYVKGNAEGIGRGAEKLRTKAGELTDKLQTKAGEKIQEVKDEGIDISGLWDKGNDLIRRGRDKVDETADHIINGTPLGDKAKEFATATGDRAKEIMAMSAEEKGRKVREYVTQMADDAGFNAEKRAQVVEAAKNAGDRTAEITIATAKKAYDAAQKAKAQIEGFAKSMWDKGDDAGVKKSADDSGPRAVILDALRESGLVENRPDLFDRTDSINMLASTLNKTMVALTKGPLNERQTKRLINLLGDDAMPVLSSLRRAVLTDADTEAFFKNVGHIADAKQRTDEFHKQIKTLLTPEALDKYNKAGFNLGELEDYLVEDARRAGGAGTFGDAALNNTSKEAYRTLFGKKAEAAMALTEKYAKQGQDKNPAALDKLPESAKLLKKPEKSGMAKDEVPARLDEAGNIVEASEGGFDETGNRVQAEKTDRMEFGQGPQRADGGRRSVKGGEKYEADSPRLKQHISDLKVRYPGHAVKFDKESGKIVVEKGVGREDGSLTDTDVEGMKIDMKKYGNSPSRLKIGDGNYDATRVMNITRRNMEKVDGERADVQIARAFHSGVAALVERHGAENVNIPDSTVIDARTKMTAGDARSLRQRMSRDDKTARDYDGKLIDIQRDWLRAALAKDEIGVAEAKKAFDATTKLADEFKAERMLGETYDRNFGAEARDLGYEMMALRGSIEAAMKKGDKQATRDLAAIYTKKLDRREELKDKAEHDARQSPENKIGEPIAGDKSGNIHEAGRYGVRGEELVNRSDVSGDPRWTDATITKAENVRRNTLAEAISRWEEQVTTEPGRRLVARAKVLLDNVDIMSANDRARFYDVGINRPESSEAPARPSRPRDALEVVNTLARRYAKQIEGRTKWKEEDKGKPINQVIKPGDVARVPEPPMPKPPAGTIPPDHTPRLPDAPPAPERGIDIRDKRVVASTEKELLRKLEYLNNPPPDYTTEMAKQILATSKRELEVSRDDGARTLLRQIIKKGEKVLEGDESLKTIEGTPDPKAVAAKKAALLERAASGDKGLIRELRTTDDAKGLQRALDVLPEGAAREAATARMSELVKDDATAYGLQTKNYSNQSVSPNATGPVNRKAVEDHINTVLGGTIRTFWPQLSIMPYAGDYTHVQKLIRISVHSLDPMSVAYHESMHGFLANMRDAGATDVVTALEKAAASPHVLVQLREFFKNEPEVLRQLKDPEERVSYMYQLWASGNLTAPPAAKTILQKVAALFRKVLGVWSNDQRAEHIMEYFNSGEYGKNVGNANAVRRALMQPGRNKVFDKAQGFTTELGNLADAVLSTGSARVRETGVPALVDIADAVKRQGGDARGGSRGFIQASRVAATKMRTEFAERIGDVNEKHLNDALEALQKNTRAVTPEGRLVVRSVRAQLKEARQYMIDAGADVGDLGKDYFPRVWDTHYISQNQQAFRAMLEPYARSGQLKGSVDNLIKKLVSSEGHEFSIETDMPGFQFGKQRVLSFITHADAAEFLNKDLLETMHSYITQATRRGEWMRIFGNGKLEAMYKRAKDEGATPEQLELTKNYLRGVDGTLGDDISPALRRLYGNTIVYQNVRLLPLAVFSSLVDPMGVVVRGGTMGDAWKTFTRGIKELPLSFSKKARTPGKAEELAELVGVIDSAMLSHVISDLYTQGMVGGTAKKINNAFFKYNMMEGLNRSFRVGATEAALKFIAKHADGTASRHSDRWMKELGLDPSDVIPKGDRIALTVGEGLTPEAEVRLHAAINQWVDGAVLRPDAADKPIWMNDPHYAIFAHLKQFIYSFQKTILERTLHEAKHGNYAPAMALGSYVPMMIASDFIKGMIQGGGEQPEWKSGWGPTEYIGYGVQRAGLLGVGQFGIDAYENMSRGGLGVTALGGPAIEQLVDVLGVIGGRKQFGSVAMDALPANALYAEAFGNEGSAGPTFTS